MPTRPTEDTMITLLRQAIDGLLPLPDLARLLDFATLRDQWEVTR